MSISQMIDETMKFYVKEMQLAAIWLPKPIRTEAELTTRITIGHKICLKDNLLIDCSEANKATHIVTDCTGTITGNKLWLHLEDLKTKEQLKLLLP